MLELCFGHDFDAMLHWRQKLAPLALRKCLTFDLSAGKTGLLNRPSLSVAVQSNCALTS